KSEEVVSLDLKPDANGYLDLPEGFSYKVISKSGQKMSDGLLVPGRPDGMGAFLDDAGRTVIICNHENSPTTLEHSPFGPSNELLSGVDLDKLFDSGSGINPGLGGTTTLIYDEEKGTVVGQYLSLAGTYRNCAGGVSPWGSWITCEEDVTKADGKQILEDHGYVFEVPRCIRPALKQSGQGVYWSNDTRIISSISDTGTAVPTVAVSSLSLRI
ncbi:MAG: alkaline phosphatase PhoX, partial [Pseudomonadota bacterium]